MIATHDADAHHADAQNTVRALFSLTHRPKSPPALLGSQPRSLVACSMPSGDRTEVEIHTQIASQLYGEFRWRNKLLKSF
jgi:hypothetical protein